MYIGILFDQITTICDVIIILIATALIPLVSP